MENKGEIDIYNLIIISTLGVLLLILFLVFVVLLYQKKMLLHKAVLIDNESKHQKKLLTATLEIAEAERIKIATNLHDDIGIALSVLKINLDRAKKNISNKPKFDEIIAESYKNINNSVDALKIIYNDLIPSSLNKLGFIKGVKELCNEINATGTIKVLFSVTNEDTLLAKGAELQLYRLIKEVLNNTIKHAKPTHIELNIDTDQINLIISILHNGIGITTEALEKLASVSVGLGLKSIFTRAQLINTKLVFLIQENNISKVIITTPQ